MPERPAFCKYASFYPFDPLSARTCLPLRERRLSVEPLSRRCSAVFTSPREETRSKCDWRVVALLRTGTRVRALRPKLCALLCNSVPRKSRFPRVSFAVAQRRRERAQKQRLKSERAVRPRASISTGSAATFRLAPTAELVHWGSHERPGSWSHLTAVDPCRSALGPLSSLTLVTANKNGRLCGPQQGRAGCVACLPALSL